MNLSANRPGPAEQPLAGDAREAPFRPRIPVAGPVMRLIALLDIMARFMLKERWPPGRFHPLAYLTPLPLAWILLLAPPALVIMNWLLT